MAVQPRSRGFLHGSDRSFTAWEEAQNRDASILYLDGGTLLV